MLDSILTFYHAGLLLEISIFHFDTYSSFLKLQMEDVFYLFKLFIFHQQFCEDNEFAKNFIKINVLNN